MSAKDVLGDIKTLRSHWRALWWKMGGGVKSEYERIKGTDVFEFFPLFDLWFESIKKQMKDIKARNGK